MRIAQINSVCGRGSTGKICVGISDLLDENGIENKVFYFYGNSNHKNAVKCASEKYIKIQAFKSRFFGNYGFNSNKATKKLITKLKDYSPDIVHIHNIHGHDVNLAMLFKYLNGTDVQVVWTFHDCWAFTGYCTYFSMIGCDKWKTECKNCPQRKKYSWFFDKSNKLHKIKGQLISKSKIIVVTPSEWLAGLAKESYFSDKNIRVINNGINLDIFKPTYDTTSVSCDKGKVLLGVADKWEERKGLDAFLELSKRLGEEYKIILVGTNDEVDKRLPESIISVHRTQNQHQLAVLYTFADVLVNPTKEDNYPTVNMEAISCGTPVITYRTGGSPEMVDSRCGSAVDFNDIDMLEKEVCRVCEDKPYSLESCLEKARDFDQNKSFMKYVELYRELTEQMTVE